MLQQSLMTRLRNIERKVVVKYKEKQTVPQSEIPHKCAHWPDNKKRDMKISITQIKMKAVQRTLT